jgi:tetratricopeptide (TPR) repeat protein
MAEKPETSDTFGRTYAEGCDLFQAGQLEEAISAFTNAASLEPLDFRPHEMRACCLGGLGRWEDSLAAFDRARELGHECHQCWYNRSIAFCRLQRADDALQALDRSLAFEPNNPRAWYDRGLILGMAYGRSPGELEPFDGRHEKAVEAFDRVIALQPDHDGAWYCKGYTLFKTSHSWSAMQGLIGAGCYQKQSDILPSALAAVERALELRPGQSEALELRKQIQEWMAESTQ